MFDHEQWMKRALEEAREAGRAGEVPVGAVVVRDAEIIGRGSNQVVRLKDPTAHAEIIAVTSAANALSNWILEDATLYVTKEPCLMCAGAVLNARISRVVFAAFDPKDGAAGSCFDVMRENRKWFVEIIPGVLASEGERMLREFFMLLRRKKNAGFPAGKDVHDGC